MPLPHLRQMQDKADEGDEDAAVFVQFDLADTVDEVEVLERDGLEAYHLFERGVGEDVVGGAVLLGGQLPAELLEG